MNADQPTDMRALLRASRSTPTGANVLARLFGNANGHDGDNPDDDPGDDGDGGHAA